jgi:hypothetical protein
VTVKKSGSDAKRSQEFLFIAHTPAEPRFYFQEPSGTFGVLATDINESPFGEPVSCPNLDVA